MSEWISVKKKMPEIHWEEVLVAIKASNANHVECAYLNSDGEWETTDKQSNAMNFITHWQPLPEPPK